MLKFVLLLLALVMIAALVGWVVRLAVRFALAISVGSLIGLVVAIATPSDAGLEPLTAGMLAALAIVVLFAACRKCARDDVSISRAKWQLDDTPLPSAPRAIERTPGADDPWSIALRLAPQARERILRAQAACAAIERQSEADEHDLALLDAATVIRRHLPALVSECEDLCRGATGAERRRYQEELIAALEQLGADSTEAEEQRRIRVRDRFRSRLAHIAARTVRAS